MVNGKVVKTPAPRPRSTRFGQVSLDGNLRIELEGRAWMVYRWNDRDGAWQRIQASNRENARKILDAYNWSVRFAKTN